MILLLAAGAIVGLLLLTMVGIWGASRRRLNAELERIRAAGEPASAVELETYYQVPPASQDTTQLWLAALAPLDSPQFNSQAAGLPFVGDGSDAIPRPGEPWSELANAEQFLARYQSSLDKMHRAARQGGRARFPTRFADGFSMLLPQAQQMRAAARLLALESAVAAHRGRSENAVESVVATFAAARSLEQEPLVISQLVRMAITAMARARLQWLLSAASLDDGQLARLDAELAATDYQHSLRRALVGERVMGIQTFENPGSLGDDAPAAIVLIGGAGDETMFLQIMEEMVAVGDQTGPARIQAAEKVEARLRQLSGATAAPLRFPVTLLLTPALSVVVQAAGRNEAERDATRVAVAIERFRLREGRLPQTLEELAPNFLDPLPIDPFDGQPLRYRLEAAEYLVYSVGLNGVDDGGRSEPPSAGQPPDIVVRIYRKDSPAASRAVPTADEQP